MGLAMAAMEAERSYLQQWVLHFHSATYMYPPPTVPAVLLQSRSTPRLATEGRGR